MVCPFCQAQMHDGSLFARDGGGIYWLPKTASMNGIFLSKKKITQSGGYVLGNISDIGFFSTQSPIAVFCNNCHAFIVKL